MKVKRFNEYIDIERMAQDFISSLDSSINEDVDSVDKYNPVQNKIVSDLKLNVKLVSTFGAGIGSLYPIVESLMKNMNIQSIEIQPETVVLLTLAAVTIIYIEEKKCKDDKEQMELTKDSKSVLEELRMRGIGDGIVKKFMKAIYSIKNIFSVIAKHFGKVVSEVIDMFAYTSMLIPIMNGIFYIVNKYDLNVDTMIENFIGLSMGVGTIIAKHGLVSLLNKLKDKISKSKRKEIASEIETPVIHKFSTFEDPKTQSGTELIKEQ